jgi:predicted AAA+ superfamily ATPase
VGKTVAMKQAISALIDSGVNPRAIVAAAADSWSERDLRTLTTNTTIPRLPDGEPRWWFIDEATAIKGDWPAQLKWLRDNDAEFRAATVVLTGSNARGLSEAIGALAGRRGTARQPDRTLMPMGFATVARLLCPDLPVIEPVELTQLHDPAIGDVFHDLVPYLDILIDAWERYLAFGGFPVAVAAGLRGDEIPVDFLDALFDVIYRDAFSGASMAEIDTTALIHRVAEGLCSPFNLVTAAQDLGRSPDTFTRRINDLRDAYLIWPCPQRSQGSATPRRGSMNKLYFVDPVSASLASLRNSAYPTPDPTMLVEQQLGMALRRRIEANSPGRWAEHDSVLHLRTPTRKEIDFVSPALGDVAIEAKYIEDGNWHGEARTVESSGFAGILATRNVLDTQGSGTGAWAVPAAMLAFLIDT